MGVVGAKDLERGDVDSVLTVLAHAHSPENGIELTMFPLCVPIIYLRLVCIRET